MLQSAKFFYRVKCEFVQQKRERKNNKKQQQQQLQLKEQSFFLSINWNIHCCCFCCFSNFSFSWCCWKERKREREKRNKTTWFLVISVIDTVTLTWRYHHVCMYARVDERTSTTTLSTTQHPPFLKRIEKTTVLVCIKSTAFFYCLQIFTLLNENKQKKTQRNILLWTAHCLMIKFVCLFVYEFHVKQKVLKTKRSLSFIFFYLFIAATFSSVGIFLFCFCSTLFFQVDRLLESYCRHHHGIGFA